MRRLLGLSGPDHTAEQLVDALVHHYHTTHRPVQIRRTDLHSAFALALTDSPVRIVLPDDRTPEEDHRVTVEMLVRCFLLPPSEREYDPSPEVVAWQKQFADAFLEPTLCQHIT